MPGKSTRAIKFSIAIILFAVAGVLFYQNTETLRQLNLIGGRSDKAVKSVVQKPPPAPPIPRPQRPAYPDRPTVAVLDFDVDRDTYLGEQTAITLSELIRQLLNGDPAYRFVERSEIARVREEHELGLFAIANPTDRLELGHWLKAHLIVTGRFVDVEETTQALDLSVIDTMTSERLAKQRIPFDQPLASPGQISSESVEALAEAIRSMLGDAHEQLANTRNARIVSLLFFRNVSSNDRLDHLEFTLPDRLSALAEQDPGVRLVRLHDPSLAMDEQELMLIGLSAGNTQAWQTAADYYMWGLIEEQRATNPEDTNNTGIQINPEDITVNVTLMLWHGLDDPIEITESAPARDIDLAMQRASARAWKVVAGELPAKISLQSRDAMVELLVKGTDFIRVRTTDAPDSWAVRRFLLYRDRLQLAWFLDPDNGSVGMKIAACYPVTGVDHPWSYLRRSLSQTNRVIRRQGVRDYRHSPRGGKSHVRVWLSDSIIEHKLDILSYMYQSYNGVDKPVKVWRSGFMGGFSHDLTFPYLRLPPDMPTDVAEIIHEQILTELISLGKAINHAVSQVASTIGERKSSSSFYLPGFTDREARELILKLDHASPQRRVEAWDVWWPVMEEDWNWRYGKPLEAYNRHEHRDVNSVSDMFAAAGQADRFLSQYAPYKAFEADDPPGAATVPAIKPATDFEALRQEVATLRAARKLRTPSKPKPLTETQNAPIPPAPWSVRVQRLMDSADISAHLRQNLKANVRLRTARYQDPDAFPDLIPKHPDIPPLEYTGFPLSFWFDDEALMRVGDWHRRRVEPTGMSWFGERLLSLGTIRAHAPNGALTSYSRPLALGPVSLAYEPLSKGLPEMIVPVDLVSFANDIWLATRQDGLLRYHPASETYEAFVGDDGLSSRHLDKLRLIGDQLLVIDRQRQFTLISDLQAERPTIQDLQVPLPKHASVARAEVAGRNVLIGDGSMYWFNIDTKLVVDVDQWLAKHAQAINAEGSPIWIQAAGEHFWVMYSDKLVRIHADLDDLDVWTTPIPPLDNVIIHEQGAFVWFAYTWETSANTRPRGLFGWSFAPQKPVSISQIVTWLPQSGRVAGQWQLEAEVTHMTSRNGRLYVAVTGALCDLIEFDMYRLSQQMGIERASLDTLWPGDAGLHMQGSAAIAWEAYRGDIAALRKRKDSGELTRAKFRPDGGSVLCSAIRGGDVEVISFLLDIGFDANTASWHTPHHSPVILAAMQNRPDILDLLYTNGAQLDVSSPSLGQPLHAATLNRAYPAMQWLVDHGAPYDAYVRTAEQSAEGPSGNLRLTWFRPLTIAIAQGDERALNILLEAGADPRGCDRDAIPPASYALLKGHHGILSRLLEAGADPGEPDARGLSPLAYALNIGDMATAELLIDAGSNRQAYAPELVLAAISLGSKDLVEKLIDSGIHIDTPFFNDGTTRMGFRFDNSDGGTTPAVWAVHKGQIEIYDWMVNENGLNMDQPVGDLRQGDLLASALALRAYLGRAIDLVSRGYSIDVPYGPSERSALMSAAKYERLEEVRILLRLGADPYARDEDGKRAIDLTDNEEIHQMLSSYK